MLSFNKFLLALHNHFIKPIKLNIEPVTLLAGATALGGWLGAGTRLPSGIDQHTAELLTRSRAGEELNEIEQLEME